MCCPLVFEFSVGIGAFVIGLGQISFFFSLCSNQLRTIRPIIQNCMFCVHFVRSIESNVFLIPGLLNPHNILYEYTSISGFIFVYIEGAFHIPIITLRWYSPAMKRKKTVPNIFT